MIIKGVFFKRSTRVLLALAGLAIGFAVPVLAKEKEEKDTADPQMAQQIRALAMKYDAAFNSSTGTTRPPSPRFTRRTRFL